MLASVDSLSFVAVPVVFGQYGCFWTLTRENAARVEYLQLRRENAPCSADRPMGVRPVSVLCGALLVQLLLVSVSGSADPRSGDDAVLVRLHIAHPSLPSMQHEVSSDTTALRDPSPTDSTVSCRPQQRAGRCSPAGRRPRTAPRGSPRSPRWPDAAGRPTVPAASAARRCAQASTLSDGQVKSNDRQRTDDVKCRRDVVRATVQPVLILGAAPRSCRSARRPLATTASRTAKRRAWTAAGPAKLAKHARSPPCRRGRWRPCTLWCAPLRCPVGRNLDECLPHPTWSKRCQMEAHPRRHVVDLHSYWRAEPPL